MSNNFSPNISRRNFLLSVRESNPNFLLPNHSIFMCVALSESGCKYTTFFSYQTRIKMLKFLPLFWSHFLRTYPASLPKNRRAKILPFSLYKQTFFSLFFKPLDERKTVFYIRFWSGKYRTISKPRKHFSELFFNLFT